jgi:hypothetical protein
LVTDGLIFTTNEGHEGFALLFLSPASEEG